MIRGIKEPEPGLTRTKNRLGTEPNNQFVTELGTPLKPVWKRLKPNKYKMELV
ncbi:hypothetical protein HanPSC8_Chr14g0597041 [Helianthus annuus]|nr:hypothetical protein HanPSC8_Chr14g0597041 [Helianthus annuus]